MAYKKNIPKKIYKKVYGSRKAPQAIGATAKVAKDVAQLGASVAMIMSRLNVEKGYVDRDVITTTLGQCNDSGEGAQLFDVTPIISQGDGQGQRHGNSLKVTGISLPFQITAQVANQGGRRVRVSLLRVRSADNGVDAVEAFNQYWDVNPLNNLRDFNAPKNYRAGSHDGITCVRSKTYYLKGPSVMDSSAAINNETNAITAKFNVKLQEVFRYAQNADTLPDGLRYYLIIQSDLGNKGTSTSALDVPIQTPLSGCNLRISQRSWYVDN